MNRRLEVLTFTCNMFWWWSKDRSSRPEVFLGKGTLKLCSRFTGEHPVTILVTYLKAKMKKLYKTLSPPFVTKEFKNIWINKQNKNVWRVKFYKRFHIFFTHSVPILDNIRPSRNFMNEHCPWNFGDVCRNYTIIYWKISGPIL